MNYSDIRLIDALAWCSLLLATVVMFATGCDGMGFYAVSVITGALWLGLIELNLRSLFARFLLVGARIRILWPAVIGMLFALVTLITSSSLVVDLVAALEFALWLRLFVLYRVHDHRYQQVGNGLLPKNVWFNPPAGAVATAFVVLSCGKPRAAKPSVVRLVLHVLTFGLVRKSKKLGQENGGVAHVAHEGVGHAAVFVANPQGEIEMLTSLMSTGTTIVPFSELTDHGDWIVLALEHPLDQDEIEEAWGRAQKMLAKNRQYVQEADAELQHRRLPSRIKKLLLHKLNGYHYGGLISGHLKDDEGTCIETVIDFCRSMGILPEVDPTDAIGRKGKFIGGVTPIDLLVGQILASEQPPSYSLVDLILKAFGRKKFKIAEKPAYRLLTLADQAAYLKRTTPGADAPTDAAK